MFPASGSTRKTTSINNAFSVAGFTAISTGITNTVAVSTLSGALTAATLKTMISLTGSGRFTWFSIKTIDATARTMRVKITVDGNSVYDYTSASISAANIGVFLAGFNSGVSAILPDIVYTTSLKIEIASSLTETDKFTTYWIYNTES
jgi:hypothetical protein